MRISGTFAPGGAGVPVPGGLLLDGKWSFDSAAPRSSWNAHSAVRVAEGRAPEPILVLVPMSDLEPVDDWYSAGMRGPGIPTHAGGASSVLSTVPIQRIARDSQTVGMHAYAHPSTNLELYGRVAAGLEANTVFL